LISSSHISEEEHLLLAVGHYLVFEVLQLKPEKEYTLRDQLQEKEGLGMHLNIFIFIIFNLFNFY